MVAAMAIMASSALPPSARTARPASAAAWWGAATTPRRYPGAWRSMRLPPSRVNEASKETIRGGRLRFRHKLDRDLTKDLLGAGHAIPFRYYLDANLFSS